MLNGERVYISVKVAAGDVVEVRMEQEESDDILPEPIPFTILYEDEHLLIVNKDAGIIVHPTHGHYTGLWPMELCITGNPKASASGSDRFIGLIRKRQVCWP